MMKLFRIVAGIGVLALLVSLPLPWITMNFLGKYDVTLLNIYNAISQASSDYPDFEDDPTSVLSQTYWGIGAIMITLLLFPIDILVSIASIFYRRITIVSGFLSVAVSLLWIFGLESLKTELANQIAIEGGIYGLMVAGMVSSIVSLGVGAYLPIISGLIFFAAYFTPKLQISRTEEEQLY